MHLDVVHLRNFYSSERGRIVREVLRAHFAECWPSLKRERVMGFGYATPYLGPFTTEAERVIALMPAGQGVHVWPRHAASATALVDDDDWPLLDASIDRLLVIHALETAHDPDAILRECWRVLTPGGRLIIVVPNRTGLWARSDASPFGFGRPFSRGQITNLLKGNQFATENAREALFLPPFRAHPSRLSAASWERMGRRFFPAFGGVLIIEATKQMYMGILAKSRATKATGHMRPVFMPAGLGRQSDQPR